MGPKVETIQSLKSPVLKSNVQTILRIFQTAADTVLVVLKKTHNSYVTLFFELVFYSYNVFYRYFQIKKKVYVL